MIGKCLVSAIAAMALAGSGTAGDVWTGICRSVIDGDTIEVERDGEFLQVDLAEIDAPELEQPWGTEAREYLEELTLDREISVTTEERTQTGSIIGRINVGDVDVNREMLAAGLAWTGTTEDQELIIARMTAGGARRGLWEQDSPEPPWLFRQRMKTRPTPVPVKRSLAEVARETELKKNAGGKSVIAGIPPKSSGSGKQGSGGSTDDDGTYRRTFLCPVDGLSRCAETEFNSSFQEFFKKGPGFYSTAALDYGGGKQLFLFRLGPGRSVGVTCDCSGGADCSCSIKLAPPKD